jgi:hypothetical protein
MTSTNLAFGTRQCNALECSVPFYVFLINMATSFAWQYMQTAMLVAALAALIAALRLATSSAAALATSRVRPDSIHCSAGDADVDGMQ